MATTNANNTSELDEAALAPLLADLGAAQRALTVVAPPRWRAATVGGDPGHLAVGPIGSDATFEREVAAIRAAGDARLAPDGWVLLLVADDPAEVELASLRNALWPWLHVVAIYRCGGGRCLRETLGATRELETPVTLEGVVVAAQRREHVLSPDATVRKFDTNAGGWNGEPGRPGYAHFRWMRKYVADFACAHGARRILDFGCGAGWVGIEAALTAQGARSAAQGAELCAFDPSPEMVRIAAQNARESGIARFTGRTGFGEHPPFPAEGEARFDCVISSGVVSFSPDRARWFDGLTAAAASGATLVIGDLNPLSSGMARRRARKPLVPARELNAISSDQARAELEARGLRFEAAAGYQLSWPAPQLAHFSDTRLGGLLSPLVLAWNRRAAGPTDDMTRFDSWVLRMRAP